jgi:thiamine-phosphate pyrophosphorylase
MSDPNCRLYVICPTPPPPGFDAVLAQALGAGDVAAVRMTAPAPGDAAGEALFARLRQVAHAHGTAVILDGDPALAARAGCDGAHLAGGDVAAARKALGDLQLGVWCGGSRDLAMEAGQDGADYVSFGPFFVEHGAVADQEAPAEQAGEPDEHVFEEVQGAGPELVRWWVELMELPAVAEGGVTLENCSALVAAGVDFLAVDDAVWQHPGGPAEAVRAFNQAIRAHAPEHA